MLDIGIHTIDLARWFMGEIETVYGQLQNYEYNIKQLDDIPKNECMDEIQSKNRATFPNYIDVDKIIYYMYNCKGYFCYGTSIGDIIKVSVKYL